MESKSYPKRKEIRLKEYDYSTAGTYFVTVCTAKRKCILSKIDETENVGAAIGGPFTPILTDIGKIVKSIIDHIPHIYPCVQVDNFVIMPNHIHILLTIDHHNASETYAPTLGNIINQCKGAVCKQIGEKIWQKSFYEHIIRDASDYDEKMKYIYENPIRWYYDELYVKN